MDISIESEETLKSKTKLYACLEDIREDLKGLMYIEDSLDILVKRIDNFFCKEDFSQYLERPEIKNIYLEKITYQILSIFEKDIKDDTNLQVLTDKYSKMLSVYFKFLIFKDIKNLEEIYFPDVFMKSIELLNNEQAILFTENFIKVLNIGNSLGEQTNIRIDIAPLCIMHSLFERNKHLFLQDKENILYSKLINCFINQLKLKNNVSYLVMNNKLNENNIQFALTSDFKNFINNHYCQMKKPFVFINDENLQKIFLFNKENMLVINLEIIGGTKEILNLINVALSKIQKLVQINILVDNKCVNILFSQNINVKTKEKAIDLIFDIFKNDIVKQLIDDENNKSLIDIVNFYKITEKNLLNIVDYKIKNVERELNLNNKIENLNISESNKIIKKSKKI